MEHVWSRVGSAEVATDPMGLELTDIFITFRPRERWTKATTQDELTAKIDRELMNHLGQRLAYMQPIEMRLNEMTSGVRADVGVKLYGDDFAVLTAKAKEIEAVLRTVPGVADLAVEQVTGQPVLQVKIRQDEIARYGVPAQAVLDLVECIGSKPVGEVVEGQYRFPLALRLPDGHRADPEAVGEMLVAAPAGERIPLPRLATVELTEGPSTITREWGQRRITVTCNVRGRDLGGFVAEAQKRVAEDVRLPPGRSCRWRSAPAWGPRCSGPSPRSSSAA